MTLDIKPASDANDPVIGDLARAYVDEVATHAGYPSSADALRRWVDRFVTDWCGASTELAVRAEFPLLVRVGGRPGGFALVRRLDAAPAMFDMSEFFIARQHRRRGFGRRTATWLFDCFSGSWQVREMPTNMPAQRFWRRVIADYTGGAFAETREIFAAHAGREFVVQRFDTRSGSARSRSYASPARRKPST